MFLRIVGVVNSGKSLLIAVILDVVQKELSKKLGFSLSKMGFFTIKGNIFSRSFRLSFRLVSDELIRFDVGM